MRSHRLLLAHCLCLLHLFGPRSAAAQVREHALRVYADLNLLSYVTLLRPAEGHLPRLERDTLAVGPSSGAFAGGAGFGIGFAASRHLMPQLRFAFQYLRVAARYSESHGTQLELVPSLAVLPWPQLRHVIPHFDLGLSLVHRNRGGLVGPVLSYGRDDGDMASLTVLGVGPVLTVGAHTFVVPGASLDLGLSFRALFVHDLQGTYESVDGFSLATRDYALLLNLGVSFWRPP